MTENFNQPYQPKIQPEVLDPITEQFEKQLQECNETIQKIETYFKKLKLQQSNLQKMLLDLKLEKLKQSKNYSNLEIDSV
ncbi:MAG: hypothetical protein ACKO96_45145 [Flammeovirgaceae bacterium]